MRVIDLFSGLGGFSQAFLDRGHDVTRYELAKEFEYVPCTIIKDVWELNANDLIGADIVLASPPCNHFSIASVYIHWPKPLKEPTRETREQIRLIQHTISIIKEADPKYWMLENPRGKLRSILGTPGILQCWGSWGMNALKPTHLWGKFPPVEWRNCESAKYEHAERGSKKGVQGINKKSFKKNKFAYRPQERTHRGSMLLMLSLLAYCKRICSF